MHTTCVTPHTLQSWVTKLTNMHWMQNPSIYRTTTFAAKPTPRTFDGTALLHYSNSCQQFTAYIYSTLALTSNRFWIGPQAPQPFVYLCVYQPTYTALGLTCAGNKWWVGWIAQPSEEGTTLGSWVTHPLSECVTQCANVPYLKQNKNQQAMH